MGIRDQPIIPGSPWQNGIVESLIGTFRRECLDQRVFGKSYLRRVLAAYSIYYNPDVRASGTWKGFAI